MPDDALPAPDVDQNVPAPRIPPPEESGEAHTQLARADPAMRQLIEAQGEVDPYGWPRRRFGVQGMFDGLVLHMVAQQISTAAALAIYGRIRDLLGGRVTPEGLAETSAEALRAAGASTAKARALHELGEAVVTGRFDTAALNDADDDTAFAMLVALRGIGPWSAQIFMLAELRRPDVFPAGDLGLRRAIGVLDGLPAPPSIGEAEQRAEVWRPWRSYAAAQLWRSLRRAAPPFAAADAGSS